ncbi:MAG: hypothetical protein WBV56_09465, partial [Azonexus sp.]
VDQPVSISPPTTGIACHAKRHRFRGPTLSQLRFTSFVVINLRQDLHPQECARAGRTTKKPMKYMGLIGVCC